MGKNAYWILLALVLPLCACAGGGSDDNGGAGADFDASLYYTKSEVYSKTESYSSAEVDALVESVVERRTEDTDLITAVDYAGRRSFTAPAGAAAALIRVYGYNNTGTDQTLRIRFAAAETSNADTEAVIVTVPNGRYFTSLGYAPVTATTMYAWHDYDTTPVYASSLTDISLHVNPVLWLR